MDQFSGPIPGQSLTGQPGGAPWEQAPQYSDPNEFLEMSFDKLTDKRMATRIGAMLQSGLSAEEIARTYIYSAFTSGVINPDVALLVTRPVIYQIVGVGKRLGIKDMKVMLPDKDQEDFLSNFVGLLDKQEPESTEEMLPTQEKPAFGGVLGSL